MKHDIARNQFKRGIIYSSNAVKERRSTDKIRDLLLQNGNPHKLLDRLNREARSTRVTTARLKRDKQQKHQDGFLSLPYVNEAPLYKIKSKVKKIVVKYSDSLEE